MLKVKVSTRFPEWPFVRQTPGGKGIWGNIHFFVDSDIEECDAWIVCDDLLKSEKVHCPRKNLLLVTWEPPVMKEYLRKFVDQFSTVITCHRKLRHPNVLYTQQSLPWHVGRTQRRSRNISFGKNYDELKAMGEISKEKDVSVIISDKSFTSEHRRRRRFVSHLKEHFSERLDVFGRGINEIPDKWDAIAPYRYHVVLENSFHPNYWTEKLADAFLAGAFPIFYGCPNISEYFPNRSLLIIDIDNIKKSIGSIESAISSHLFEESVTERANSRQLILDKYNFFPSLAEHIRKLDGGTRKEDIELHPMEYFGKKNYLYKLRRRIKAAHA